MPSVVEASESSFAGCELSGDADSSSPKWRQDSLSFKYRLADVEPALSWIKSSEVAATGDAQTA
jgi:hypothetical protein